MKIYLHGAGLNAESWGPLPEGRALNLPGHGGRPRAARATAQQFAVDIAPDIPEGAVLIGYSLGGMVALAFAAAHPDRLKALVLVDTPIRAPLRLVSWYTPFVAPIVTRVPGLRTIGQAVGSRIEAPDGQARFRQHIEAGTPQGMSDALCVAAGYDGRPDLDTLRLPTLVLCGRRSLLTGKTYRALVAERAPHAKIVEVDTGHHIPFDDPALMHAEIDRFLDGIAG